MIHAQESTQNYADTVTQTATHLSMVEIALGAIVHGLNIPFGGNALSINQGVFLCRASTRAPNRVTSARWAYEISGVAAVLKSLSPAGNKLGPMLSITMQGLLFSLGQLILGRGLVGQIVSMVLLAQWAFLQPVITLWLSYGSENAIGIFEFLKTQAADKFQILPATAGLIVVVIVGTKTFIALMVPLVIRKIDERRFVTLEKRITEFAKPYLNIRPTPGRSAAIGALRDLCRPLFLFSFIMMLTFWWVREPSIAKLVWLSLRPLAIGFLIFYCLRSPRVLGFISSAASHFKVLRPIREYTLNIRNKLSST